MPGSAKGVDKVAKLVSNPAARHVLAVLSNDFGDGYVRIVNTKTGAVEDAIKIDGGGVSLYPPGLFDWSVKGPQLTDPCSSLSTSGVHRRLVTYRISPRHRL